MDLILAAALTAPVPPYTPPLSGVDQNWSPIVASVKLTAPAPPYTPPSSGVDQNRPSSVTPQSSPTHNPSESWEQKMLRRYGRKVS